MNKPRHIKSHIEQGDKTLAQLLKQQKKIKKLEFALKPLLSPLLPANTPWRVSNVREQTLILETDSNGWANRIRFLSNEILKQIKTIHTEINQLIIRVRPQHNEASSEKTIQNHLFLSHTSSKMLAEFAESVEDESLARAIKRLSTHIK